MKVGIIGYKGFVGSAFFKVFSKDHKYETSGIEREDYQKARKVHYDLLINANGNSSKILAEKDPALDFEMNAVSTLHFLKDFDYSHYLHISTVEIYNDKSNAEATTENAEILPKSLSNYGLSKYYGELIVERLAKSWILLRLGGMVGEGMKKGPAYDIIKLGKLFVSEKSKYQFINTSTVAESAKLLFERRKFGEIYNVAGRGNIMLSRFASKAGVTLSSSGKDIQTFNISTKKLEEEITIPTSEQTVEEFIEAYQNNKVAIV